MTRGELLEALLVERFQPLPQRPKTPVDPGAWARLRLLKRAARGIDDDRQEEAG